MGKYDNEVFEKYGIKALEDCKTVGKKYFGIDLEGYILGFRYADLKNGVYPDKVSPKNPYTIQNIKHYLYINNINQILISDKYEKSDAKLNFYCPVHKMPYEQSWSKLNAGMNCQKCGYERMAEKSRKSGKQFIKEAKEIHGSKYGYSKVIYKNLDEKVIIFCPEHKYFEISPYGHLNSGGCQRCSDNFKMDGNEFIRKSVIKHGNKYDYNKVGFVDRDIEVEIICNETEHGSFWQTPNNHLRKTVFDKCPKCYAKNKVGGSGWTKSEWKASAENSKNFDSFKLYVIKCFNEDELFIKVGITFRSMKERFSRKARMPYIYEELVIIENDDSDIIWNLEKEIHKNLKSENLKYKPKIGFDGVTECFKFCDESLHIIGQKEK